MKNTILKEIQSLFETGEIDTIKFSKTGKTTVKYKKEPRVIQYSKSETILQTIKEHAELSKSLEAVKLKPKLNVTVEEFVKIHTFEQETKKLSLFERFYNSVGEFLSGGKSFAPNECKTFV